MVFRRQVGEQAQPEVPRLGRTVHDLIGHPHPVVDDLQDHARESLGQRHVDRVRIRVLDDVAQALLRRAIDEALLLSAEDDCRVRIDRDGRCQTTPADRGDEVVEGAGWVASPQAG